MKKYQFNAEIRAGDRGGAYVVFPYDTEKAFGTKGKVPVNAIIDGVPDRGGLFTMGKPQHMLGVPKSVREQIGKGPGEVVKVVLWKNDEVREVDVPPAFKSLMKKEGVLPFFESLSYTHRKEYCRWMTEAKKEETRARRLDKAIEMLKKGIRTPG
jgi:Domain of unknown function (DUF1905)/Bacteriocin-protection, YdeI or OmpD-Associated